MTDLTGRWSGVFNYPTELPSTTFTAGLRDTAGALSGSIDEPDIIRTGQPGIVALIEGRRDGRAVRFVKFYEANATGYDSVDYAGTIGEDGDEIAGWWNIPGAWSGTFIMVREPGAMAEIELRESLEEPVR